MNFLVLGDAKAQRAAMNSAVNKSIHQWFTDEPEQQPCLTTLTDTPDAADETFAQNTVPKMRLFCEDFGQAVSLPSYKANRPNVDYFSSDLHLQMFNICNTTLNENLICLYDERHGGKSGDEVCTMRWKYHTHILGKLIAEGKEPPNMIIKVLDNCSAQKQVKCHMHV